MNIEKPRKRENTKQYTDVSPSMPGIIVNVTSSTLCGVIYLPNVLEKPKYGVRKGGIDSNGSQGTF